MACGQAINSTAYRKHFIGLIQHEHLHGVGFEDTALNHVLDTTWCANDDLGTFLKSLHIVSNASSANTRVTLDVHEIADGDDDLLNLLGKLTGRCKNQSLASLDVGVKLLQDGDGEGRGLSSA